MRSKQQDASLISIGGLAKASGVPPETIRNWERRYGFPPAQRRDSGHRRYALSLVPHLKLVRRAVEQGYRPAFATTATMEELRTLIDEEVRRNRPNDANGLNVDSCLRWVEAFDALGLDHALERAWAIHGAERFIEQLAVPFLRELGVRWQEGRMSVAHEHFASNVVVGFLRRRWRPLADGGRGPTAVLATPDGQQHSLALHMAAALLTIHERRILFLGASSPVEDVERAVRSSPANLVVVGLSTASDPLQSQAWLSRLRAGLDADINIIAGGDTRVPDIAGVEILESFEAFGRWLDASDPTSMHGV